ncbi:MAG: CDP-diacylglycerol--serine O-phosphatidyltransferase [endosymbiont of Galathealinum brachiosum]|uniref:CDP-diacylglycerol--serine O-phosphatidyltransferase n=1 Tax=endosymbiont of Galathealinum brachiosum TaxID=2200906 RepID=A0A370DJ05_9GAMM|nr:MAG: CDP-diacylglycerol--serine O-phosphatidyltransferase [endosymbiont of Galathealinum brachiosum]
MQNKKKPSFRRRGIYLLPNIFTTGAMFAGFYAVVASMNGQFEKAAIAIFIAMILDGVDGRVARMTNTQSEFGAEYDSLSDMVSFGVAPALVMYQWSFSSMVDMGWQWGKLGWMAAFIYTASAALRLARFNTQVGIADKRYFQGLPSPAAAAVIAALVWVGVDNNIAGADVAVFMVIITIAMGVMMVSNILFYSFKEVHFKGKVPFYTIIIVVLVLALASLDISKALLLVFGLYALSGPVLSIRKLRKLTKKKSL